MIAEGQVGIQLLNDGANQTLRMTKLAALVVQELHGRYYETNYRGYLFCACNTAATALSTLSTTATGLILTNPAGSGKNLLINDVCVALATAPAGISTIGLAANINVIATAVTQTTPLVVRAAFLGSGTAAVGLAASAATLPAAPVFIRAIGGGPVATGTLTAPFIRDEIAGSIMLAPGSAVSLSYLTTAISVVASISWEELPI